MKATQEYSDVFIERAIAMHEGDSIPGFPSVDVFFYLIYSIDCFLEKIIIFFILLISQL